MTVTSVASDLYFYSVLNIVCFDCISGCEQVLSLRIFSLTQWTILRLYDNNCEDSLTMASVVCRNMLEDWRHVKNAFSVCKIGSTN